MADEISPVPKNENLFSHRWRWRCSETNLWSGHGIARQLLEKGPCCSLAGYYDGLLGSALRPGSVPRSRKTNPSGECKQYPFSDYHKVSSRALNRAKTCPLTLQATWRARNLSTWYLYNAHMAKISVSARIVCMIARLLRTPWTRTQRWKG